MKIFNVSQFRKITLKKIEAIQDEDFLVINAKTKKVLFRASPIVVKSEKIKTGNNRA